MVALLAQYHILCLFGPSILDKSNPSLPFTSPSKLGLFCHVPKIVVILFHMQVGWFSSPLALCQYIYIFSKDGLTKHI
jgi:hypothetical protein